MAEHGEIGASRLRAGARVSAVGICCNLCLAGMKCAVGLSLGSVAVLSDAANNLSDTFSSLIALVGLRAAAAPADRQHPFGHGRVEYLAALAASLLVLAAGAALLISSVRGILSPVEIGFSALSAGLLALSIAVKGALSRYMRLAGERLRTGVLIAAAVDARSDMLVTAITLLSVLLCRFAPGVRVDGWAGALVSVYVLWEGAQLMRGALTPLIGAPEDAALCGKITQVVSAVPGVMGTHDLVLHTYGADRTMASIHVELPASLTFTEAHRIADEAERAAEKALGVTLVAHADPVEAEDDRARLRAALREIDPRLTAHDVHWRNGDVLTFDLVVPYSYQEAEVTGLLERIAARLHPARVDIHVDRDLTGEM